MEVTNTPDGKLPTETAANAGSTEVARSADSAKRHDLNFITSNNKIDAEYQLPVTADAKGTWVCQLLDVRCVLHESAFVTFLCILEALFTAFQA